MLTKSGVLRLLISGVVVFSCAGTQSIGAGLWGTLGGGSGVSALANSFASSLTKNAAASRALGAAGVEGAKNGLYNTLAKTGGYGIEKGSDLASVLKGMKLDKEAVNGIGESLTAAMKDQSLGATQQAAVTELWKPISQGLAK